MTTLKDIRQQYPQYDDMPDAALADAMHRKFYGDMPRADFDKKLGLTPATPTEPEKPMTSSAGDMALEPFRGFNKGVASFVTAPYRAVDWALEKTVGDDWSLPDVDKTSFWGPYLSPKEPESKVGKYLRAAGEGIGASALPLAATAQAATKIAPVAEQATSTLGGLWQGAKEAYRAAPGTAVATDVAAGAGSGIGAHVAEDAGYGPTGQFLGAVVGGLTPAGVMAYRTPSTTPIGTRTGQSLARERANEAQRDAQAFNDLKVRPFGPAFNQGPVASIGKQTAETPILGAPLKNNFDETMRDSADAARRIATEISPGAMPETAGRSVQRGLERYGRENMRTIDEDRLTAIGVNPTAAVPSQNIMSNEARNRMLQAETIRNTDRAAVYNQSIANGASPDDAARMANRQVPPLAQGTHNAVLARRGAEDLSDAELGRVITAPSVDTSFRTKQEALYEQAWRQLPTQMRANNTANPQRIAAVNTRQAIRQIEGQVANQISGQTAIGGPLVARFGNVNSHFSLPDLRAIRTEIGRSMDEYNPTQQSLSQSQLRSLYASLSRDIEVGVQDLANRALINSRLPANDPAHVPPQVANQAARALRYFQRADTYTRAGMERMERFNTVLGTENPQQAAHRLITAATDTTKGNMQMVRAAAGALRPEDRTEIASMMVQELGRPIKSARGIVQEVGWSPNTFVTNYNGMSQEARALFFGPEHTEAIDNLFHVANRLSNVEALTNTSRSGTNTMNTTGALAGAGSLFAGNVAMPLTIGGSMLGTSILMSRPAYTNWMIRYMQLRAAIRDGTDRSIAPMIRHVTGLERMAQDNPALWPAYAAVATEVEDFKKDDGAAKSKPTVTQPKPNAASVNSNESRLLSQARNALARDAKRSDIEARLRSLGVDPGKL